MTIRSPFLVLGVFFGLFNARAQSNAPIVDINSTRALSFDNGFFFNNPNLNSAGYTMNCEFVNCPSMIYGLGFWFGGLDQNNALKVSASSYGFNSFSPGPYSSNSSYALPAYSNVYNPAIWIVKREDIIYHIDNYNQPQYQIPQAILNWPAHGDADLGTADNLAPFVDVDNDGIYNPLHGDYPCIKGDMASYIILNDHRPVSNPAGESMGLEIHAMTYQFSSDDFIDSTTFLELKIINQGDRIYTDFKSAMFVDFSLGGSGDDYVSVFPDKNTFFVMNGDDFDETVGSAIGFLENPPAAGIRLLNSSLTHGARFGNISQSGNLVPVHMPNSTNHFWSYLNGTWIDGASFVQGSGYPFNTDSTYVPTNFAFGNNAYYSEGGQVFSNFQFNPRGYVSFENQLLGQNQEIQLDFAIFMNRQGDYIENMQGLYQYADLVQDFYSNNIVAYNCQQQGTGIPDDFSPPFDWSPWMVQVKRLDGRGNMGFSIDLTDQSFSQALWNNFAEILEYKASKAPIYVKIENPGNHVLGRFELKFRDYDAHISAIDTASWTIYRYHHLSDVFLDSVNSESTIDIGELQYIPQWGISVQVKQQNYFFSSGILPISQNLSTTPIEVTNHFDTETSGWLTGVKDNYALNSENWILSGFNYFFDTTDNLCYTSLQKDGEGFWSGLLDGTVGHFSLLRSCGQMAPIGANNNLNINAARTRAVIAQTPSVDLLFTHEKDKWTRCVVVEMCDDATISQGGAQKMKPRNRPSVDKNGHSAGHPDYNAAEGDLISPVGMGWFPGFAIDVETGRRLNVVFGENSFFANQNGSDMLWNPTSEMYDQVGNPRFGGQHVVFVIGENINNSGMPIYDSCAAFFNNISSTNNNLNRDAWQSATWTMYPMLREGHDLLEKPVLIRMRVNKRYEDHVITGINDGKPAFEWNISSLLPTDLSIDEALVPDALIFPNPTQNHFFIQFQNMQPDFVRVFALTGVLVHEQAVSGGENVLKIEAGNLASGVYVVQVGEVIRRVVVE
jgi:hypothetical protein